MTTDATDATYLLRLLTDQGPTYNDCGVVQCVYCGCLTYFRPDEGIPIPKPHADGCPWRLAKVFVENLEEKSKMKHGRAMTSEEQVTFLAEGAAKCPFCKHEGMYPPVRPRRMDGNKQVQALLECRECHSIVTVVYTLSEVSYSKERIV